MIKIDELTVGQLKELRSYWEFSHNVTSSSKPHPMLGRRCLVRTYAAGVHIGDVIMIEGRECLLKPAIRLWKWEGGGLSLSAIARNGVVRARLNRTDEVYLTGVEEFIPTTQQAEDSFAKFIED